MNTKDFIRLYARERPLFLSVLRGKEAALYQQFLPLKGPVLDVGCGDGFFAHITFAEKKIDTGLDMESSRIREAKDSSAYKKIVTYDGYTIPFPNRTFQTVVVNSVLEHVDDLPRVIKEMYRVVRPGGTCIATVMAAPWEEYLLGAKLFGPWYRTWMKRKQVHKNLLSYGDWVRAFTAAGFRKEFVSSYLGNRAGSLLDALHYVSLPSLVSYIAVKKWVIIPQLTGWYPCGYFAQCMDEPVSAAEAGALFFVFRRP